MILSRVVVLIAATAGMLSAQVAVGTGGLETQDADAIHRALAEGRYKDGLTRVKAAARRSGAFGRSWYTTNLYATIGLFWLEVGNLPEAEKWVKEAKSFAESNFSTGSMLYERNGQRIMAALQFETGDYASVLKETLSLYRNGKDLPTTPTGAYRFGLVAQAHLRLGDQADADGLVKRAHAVIGQINKKSLFYGPRLLYAACLVESHAGKFMEGEQHCRHGISLVENSGTKSRDLTLGYLALAESLLLQEKMPDAEAAAKQTAMLALELFGSPHQDLAESLRILAVINAKTGRTENAKILARDARNMIASVFGENSARAHQFADSLRDVMAP